MRAAAQALEFEHAIAIRDQISDLKKKMERKKEKAKKKKK